MMTIQVRRAFKDGVPRAFKRNGLYLIGVYLLMALFQGGLVYMVATTVLPLGAISPGSPGGQGPVPGGQPPTMIMLQAIGITAIVGGILTVPVEVVANRTLVSEFTDRIPEEFVFHRMGWATLNVLIGTWLIQIVVAVLAVGMFAAVRWGIPSVWDGAMVLLLTGTWLERIPLVVIALMLLIPAAFLQMSLLFFGQEVSIKDKNLFRAMRGSWALARGNRLRLIVLIAGPFVFHLPFSFAVPFLLGAIPAQVIVGLESGVYYIITVAIMARAYVQVHAREAGNGSDGALSANEDLTLRYIEGARAVE